MLVFSVRVLRGVLPGYDTGVPLDAELFPLLHQFDDQPTLLRALQREVISEKLENFERKPNFQIPSHVHEDITV